MSSKKNLLDEIEFCLKLWQNQGHCTFGGYTKCQKCAAPYLLWKLVTGEILHASDKKRLTLCEWQELLQKRNHKQS